MLQGKALGARRRLPSVQDDMEKACVTGQVKAGPRIMVYQDNHSRTCIPFSLSLHLTGYLLLLFTAVCLEGFIAFKGIRIGLFFLFFFFSLVLK